MAEFPAALRAALDAYYGAARGVRDISRPIEHRQGLTARLNAIEKAYGGRKGAAAAIGTVPDTVTRWQNNQRQPSKGHRDAIEKVYEALRKANLVKSKGAPAGFTVHAIVVCDPAGARYKNAHNSGPLANNAPSDSGYRPFRADSLTASQRQDIATAYAAGVSPQGVAEVMLGAVGRQYPEPFAFEGSNVVVEIR